LSKLEASQKEFSNVQGEELERLRQENQALSQENESLKAAYGSQASSPGLSTLSSTDLRGSSSNLTSYGSNNPGYLDPLAIAQAFTASTMPGNIPAVAPSPLSSTSGDPNNLVVVVPNNIQEIRRRLHQMFAPVLEIPIISNPQNHLATLAALEPTLPTPLKPSPLQLSTPHHAYIDMLPSPSLRDRLIAIGPSNANTFLTEACTIACDIEDKGQMIVWGEDWLNEFSWEFSAATLQRWGGWLLTSEWAQRANFWRRQRGAEILQGYE
jgi:hypothetical protein